MLRQSTVITLQAYLRMCTCKLPEVAGFLEVKDFYDYIVTPVLAQKAEILPSLRLSSATESNSKALEHLPPPEHLLIESLYPKCH